MMTKQKKNENNLVIFGISLVTLHNGDGQSNAVMDKLKDPKKVLIGRGKNILEITACDPIIGIWLQLLK